MNTKEVFEIITRIELELKNDILNSNNEVWPIFRNTAWHVLTSPVKKSSLKFRRKNFNDLVYFMKNYLVKKVYKLISFLKSKKYKDKDIKIMFLSRTSFLEKEISKKWLDRIVDSIYNVSNKNIPSLKLYFNFNKKLFNLKDNDWMILDLKNRKRVKDDFFYNSNKEFKLIEKELNELTNKFIALSKIEDYSKILKISLKKNLRTYFSYKNLGYELFNKYQSVTKIFLTSWDFPDAMGIISAATEKGISSVDIQHGKQGKYCGSYAGWNVIPTKGFKNLPTSFWCWGDVSVKHIQNQNKQRKIHIPFVGGYTSPFYQNMCGKKLLENKKKQKAIKLLFTIQPPQGDNLDPLPDGLIDLLISKNNILPEKDKRNFFVRIRLHPNAAEKLENYLKLKLGKIYFHKNLSITSNKNHHLYKDFKWATHHLTCYSSCSLEAISFGLPSAVYGKEAMSIFEDEIKNKQLIFLNNAEKKDLEKFVFKEDNILKNDDIKKWMTVKKPSLKDII